MRSSVDVMMGGRLVGYQMQIAVTHAGFRDGGFSKFADFVGVSLEQGDFEAILIIEMDVERRKHEVMMGVLRPGQSPR